MLVYDVITGMLLVSAVSMGALGLYGMKFFKRIPAALPYSLLMVAAAGWAFLYALELLAGSLPLKILFHNLRFLFLPYFSVLELWLVIAFVKKTEWLRREWAILALIIPVAATILALTSQFHTFFRYNFSISTTGPVAILQYSEAPFFEIYIWYSFALLILAYLILILETRKQQTLAEKQTVLLLVALIFPTVINYLFVEGITPVTGINMTAPLLWIAAILYTVAIFRFQFLSVIPVARGRLIEIMSTLMLVLDTDGRIIDANPAARSFFSIPGGTVPGMFVAEVARDWPEFLALCRSEEAGNTELARFGKAGVQTFMATVDLFRTLSGEPEGRLIFLQDITEQKKAEEALRKSEERYDLTIRAVNDGVWDWNLPTGKAYFSPTYYTMLGYEPGEFSGSYASFCSLVHPDDLAALETKIQHHVERSENYAIEFRARTKGGEWRWILTRGMVVERDTNGQPVRMVGTHTDITARKEAERKITHLASFPQLSPALIFEIDPTEHVLFVNPSLQSTLDRLKMSSPLPFIPNDVHTLLRNWDTKTKTNISREISIADKQFDEAIYFTPEFKSIRFYLTDITDRKRAEENLQESEKKYRQLIELAQEGIWTIDAQANTTFVNPRIAEILGYTAEEMIGRSLYSFMDERGVALAQYNMERRKQGIREQHDFEFIRKDGNRVYTSLETTPLTDETGNFTGALAVVADITQRKQVEDALRETKEFLENLIEYANAPIIVWNPQFQITEFNHAFEVMTGLRREEVLGQSLSILFPADSRNKSLDFIRQTRAGERWETVEIPIYHVSGETRIVLWNSANILDSRGTVIATIAQGQDITRRKQAELALHQANRKLNLLSSITRHDILNQMTALRGYLFLSQESLNNPERITDFLKQADKSAETIARQITFTKEYQDLGVKVSTWQNVQECIHKARTELPMRNIHVDIDRADLEVFADPLFEKVFYNLIDNALRYGGERMTAIHVFSQETDNGLVITCEDDGVGITEEDKKRLFTKGFGKHTGLGLFLTREILCITGISIIENGVPRKGARFEITVPKGIYRFNKTR